MSITVNRWFLALQALRTNRTLLHLSVSHNGIGNDGAKAFADVSVTFENSDELFYLIFSLFAERCDFVLRTD